jgi:GGDEF domain-containing protein
MPQSGKKASAARAGKAAAATSGVREPERTLLRPTCVDSESGFCHQEHFERTLRCEMARVLETEKPLGLLVLSLKGAGPERYAALGEVFSQELRRIDVPARLSDGSVAVILPRVSLLRLSRQLPRIDGPLREKRPPLKAEYGFSLFRADGGEDPQDLLREAREFMSAEELSKKLRDKSGRFADSEVLAEEKDTLFKGFSALRGETPEEGRDENKSGGGSSQL